MVEGLAALQQVDGPRVIVTLVSADDRAPDPAFGSVAV